jgi:hypothetical protein
MVITPAPNPDISLKKSVKIMPYIGMAFTLLSIILLPLMFSASAIILGAYSYIKGEKKGIIPITLGLLLLLDYIFVILRRLFAY